MRNILLIVGAVALMPATASAQQSHPSMRDSTHMSHMQHGNPLMAGIALSADQTRQMEAIRAEEERGNDRPMAGSMEARMHDGSMADRGSDSVTSNIRGTMMMRMKTRIAAMRAILTPAQQRIFDTNVQRMRQEHAEHERGDRGMPEKP